MIAYKEITLKDKAWIDMKLKESNFRGSEYCFSNQFLWGRLLHVEVADVQDCFCTRFSKKNFFVHDFPAGKGKVEAAIAELIEDDLQKGKKTVIRGMTILQKEWMEYKFPNTFVYKAKRKEWDYLYPTDILLSLKGRKFHGKRNHIARFMESGSWQFEAIATENIQECRSMYEEWLQQNEERLDESIVLERKILEDCILYFSELGLEGGILKQDGHVVAFCIGEPLNLDTYIVHIEKAFTHVQGAYPMINQQFVMHNMEGYSYVNREDDLGIEGLRKAKMSYDPEMLEKYEARIL